MKEIRISTRYSKQKDEFLKSLTHDLVSIGAQVDLRRCCRKLYFAARIPQVGKETQISQLKAIRNRRLWSEVQFISKMEKRGIKTLFPDGREIDLNKIKPAIHICHATKDYEIFHYCRLLQSFPTANLIGRQLRALVFDEGQERQMIMGAIGLSSSPYSLACRDIFLNWNKNMKHRQFIRRLDSLMQLAVCMSWPPYSYLLGGKLMAALALSQTFADEYCRKYKKKLRPGTKLLGLVSISASGMHCPIFHRIMLRSGGLYRRIGKTAGYTTAHFSEATMDRARLLLKVSGRREDEAIFGKSLRVIKCALRICNLPYEPLVKSGLQKGVYMGFATAKALENLRKGLTSETVPILTETQIIRHWKERILPTRISRRDVVSKLVRFKSHKLLLGPQLHLRNSDNA